jgi:hypothetical protein
MMRNLQDRFRRERLRILSSLCQGHLQPVFPWDPDVLDQMYRQCWQECTAVVTQLLASGTSNALSQHQTNTHFTQPLDEAGLPIPYSSVQLGSTSVPQQNGLNLNPLQVQQWLANQGYPSFNQPNGSIESNHFYSNMGPTSLTIPDCCAPPKSPDVGDAEAMLDLGFAPPHEFVDQNTSSWDDLPFMYRSDLGHLYS